MTASERSSPSYTDRQGQFLAFIYCYTKVNGRPPAEADMCRFFGVTPPVVHDMIKLLERKGLISRQRGVPGRSSCCCHVRSYPTSTERRHVRPDGT